MAQITIQTKSIGRAFASAFNYSLSSHKRNKEEWTKAKKNLSRAALAVLTEEANKIRNKMLQRFDLTSKYSKPSRRTGRIREALNILTVSRKGDTIYALIGSKSKLPRTRGPRGFPYWKAQEEGTQPFQFNQHYIPISTDDGRGFRLFSRKKEYFLSRPSKESFVIKVRNPGIRPRGFIRAGETYAHAIMPIIAGKVIQKALPRVKK